MHFTLLISALAATALASPLATTPITKTGESDTWQAAAGTTTTCETATFFHISFTRGPPIESVLNNACAAMMPECAFRDRLPSGKLCTATIDYQLDFPKSSTQHVDVVDSNGTILDGWDVKFEVTPATQPKDFPGVFWQVQDCYGYFHRILEKMSPEGCHSSAGSGPGSLKVGGDSTLAGTEFVVTLVPRQD